MANLNIEQKNVRTVFQEAKYMYLIPDYQRPYEWGEEECKRLWDDARLFAKGAFNMVAAPFKAFFIFH